VYDPPAAFFAADSSYGDETDPSAQVEVILAYPTSRTVTVDYAVTGGTQAEHAYRIRDDEAGIPFDGMVWYHSEIPAFLDLTDDGELQWAPAKYQQVVVRLPEQRLSQQGDVAVFTYLWKSDGAYGDCSCDHRGDGCDCFRSDITCLDGTNGDFHLGLFDSNGRGYVDDVTSTETLKGNVWSFTTTPCVVFENFNSFAAKSPITACFVAGKRAWK